jgi:hypothetical protein
LKIFTLKSFVDGKAALSEFEFENHFNTNKEYYFIASESENK